MSHESFESFELTSDPSRDHSLDPRFVFDFVAYDELDPESDGDFAASGRRWSTWLSVEPLCRGPEPRPDWVVTSQAAIDTDLGVLKTGKEADAHLLERAVPGVSPDQAAPGDYAVMVAKRYRGEEHRTFHRSAAYTEGRRTKSSRDARALAKRTAYGRSVAAGQWARAEWDALVRCHGLGLPVPYPVQVDGTEILMEWIQVDGPAGPETAPRLAQTRPEPDLLADYFGQLRSILVALAEQGLVHGDLSPYNVLAAGERLVVIDLPQMVDLVANPAGADFLLRDCTNVCAWFRQRGLDPAVADEHALFGELMTVAF